MKKQSSHAPECCRGHLLSLVIVLPIFDLYSGDKAYIFSTLQYLCNLAYKHRSTAVLTFDQPLNQKTPEFKEDVSENNPVRIIVLISGSFHTLLKLMGTIGRLQDGSGIKEILGTIYGEHGVQQIMTGNAVQRDARGNLHLEQCLTQQVTNSLRSSRFCIHLLRT